MSKEEKRAPEVRFEGFYDDWKQRKLTNLVSAIKSYPLSRSVETEKNTGIRYIHYGDIHTKRADKITSKSNIPNINVGDYKYLEKGDLALADASEDHQGIAMPSVILEKTPFNIVAGLHTIALRPKEIDPLYLYYLIYSPTFRKYGYKVGTGMKVFGISKNNILKFETLFPCIEEQIKISSLLNKIDNVIALHQRKLDKLQELKKAALQALFPQKNETEPKVRFANLNGLWKRCKLGELGEIVGGGTPNTNIKEYWDGNINWYSPVEIGNDTYVYESKKKITELGLQKSSAKKLPANKTILFTSRAGIGDMAILGSDGATNQGFQSIIVKGNNDVYFLYSYGNKIKSKAIKYASGSTFLEISGQELSKIQLKVPSLIEQQKLGIFFKKIDNTIVLHRKRFKKLQVLKKSLLTKMLI